MAHHTYHFVKIGPLLDKVGLYDLVSELIIVNDKTAYMLFKEFLVSFPSKFIKRNDNIKKLLPARIKRVPVQDPVALWGRCMEICVLTSSGTVVTFDDTLTCQNILRFDLPFVLTPTTYYVIKEDKLQIYSPNCRACELDYDWRSWHEVSHKDLRAFRLEEDEDIRLLSASGDKMIWLGQDYHQFSYGRHHTRAGKHMSWWSGSNILKIELAFATTQ